MCDDNDTLFKVLAVVSPLASGALSGLLSYFFSIRSKKSEYLYQYRIPAFVAVFKVVAEIKKYAEGQIALSLGAEFAPVFDEPGSPLSLRISLSEVRETNDIFLTNACRGALNQIDADLGMLSSAYLNQKNPDGSNDYEIDYSPLRDKAQKAQQIMYSEMELPKR